MSDAATPSTFPSLNRAYNTVFKPGALTVGLVVQLDAHRGSSVPDMARHLKRVQMVDELGFAVLWLRDVSFRVPTFGDAGLMFDPFVYLGPLSGVTQNIALGVASTILTLRHSAYVAKTAASVDQLSGGCLLLGVAFGDRPEEYPALGMSFTDRGARFRESLDYIRVVAAGYPAYTGDHVVL